MGQWFTPSVIIAAISLLVSFAALVRTWRHEPEASWMHTSIVSDLPGIVPSLSDERGRMPVRMGMLSNDGDGDAFAMCESSDTTASFARMHGKSSKTADGKSANAR